MKSLDLISVKKYVRAKEISQPIIKRRSTAAKAANEDFFTQTIISSSRPQMFYKMDFLKNLAKFTGKHLCRGLFFHKDEERDFRAAVFL